LNGIEWPEVPPAILRGEAELMVKVQQTQSSPNQSRIMLEGQQGSVDDASPISIQSTNCEPPNLEINAPLTMAGPENPATLENYTLTPVAREQSNSAIQLEVSAQGAITDILLPVEQEGAVETAGSSLLPQGVRVGT
jgi:hypothetical protein